MGSVAPASEVTGRMCALTPQREREGDGISSVSAREAGFLRDCRSIHFGGYTHSADPQPLWWARPRASRKAARSYSESFVACEAGRGRSGKGMGLEGAEHGRGVENLGESRPQRQRNGVGGR